MSLNKQINIWRGNNTPPTPHHLWIYNESLLKMFINGEWITIIDSIEVTTRLNEISEKVDELYDSTVNNKLIRDNPVLSASDLKSNVDGEFLDVNDNVDLALKKLDEMATIQIIE